MKVVVLMERNVTDSVTIEVESMEELVLIMSEPMLLHQAVDNQGERWEEVVGECIDVRYEDENGNEFNLRDLVAHD